MNKKVVAAVLTIALFSAVFLKWLLCARYRSAFFLTDFLLDLLFALLLLFVVLRILRRR